jgi:hypothetical protein
LPSYKNSENFPKELLDTTQEKYRNLRREIDINGSLQEVGPEFYRILGS